MTATKTRQHQGLERLATLMNRRRLELGKRWEDIAADGDLSIKTLRDIRNGRGAIPRDLTLRKIDAGLQWAPGSAARCVALQGDPEPLPAEVPGPEPGDDYATRLDDFADWLESQPEAVQERALGVIFRRTRREAS